MAMAMNTSSVRANRAKSRRFVGSFRSLGMTRRRWKCAGDAEQDQDGRFGDDEQSIRLQQVAE